MGGWCVIFLVCVGVVLGDARDLRIAEAGWAMEAPNAQREADRALGASEAIGLEVGDRPPPFSARDLTGTRHALTSYQGCVLVLHFWASWCPYCRGEIPKITALHNEWRLKGVQVLTISTDRDAEQLRRFVKQAALPYPVIADGEVRSSVADEYGISGIPVTYIVAPDGRIASRLDGSADIVGAVQDALEHSPPA